MESTDPYSDSGLSDGEDCFTPTATHCTLAPYDSSPPSYASAARAPVAVCPQKNTIFIIRDPQTDLVIAVKDGILGLYPDEKERSDSGAPHHGRGSHWICIENGELWFGFRSAVSGCYIGHNNNKGGRWRFIAEEKWHRAWEWFCAREHPDGGHVLLVKHNDGFRAMKAGGEGKRELLFGDKGEAGTRWDFIKITSSG